jgi:hypothetical protein
MAGSSSTSSIMLPLPQELAADGTPFDFEVDSELPEIVDLNGDKRKADILLRLSIALGQSAGVSKQICDDFNGVLARLAEGYHPDEKFASAVKNALGEAFALLKDKLEDPVAYNDKSEAQKFRLTLADASLLRAACFFYDVKSYTSHNLCEYVPSSRGAQSQKSQSVITFLRRGPAGDKGMPDQFINHNVNMEAYSTAQNLMNNFDEGLSNIQELSTLGNNDIKLFLKAAKRPMSSFLYGFMIPNLLDGQRMQATNAIAARFLGLSSSAFGNVKSVEKATTSSESFTMSLRLQYSVSILQVMCKKGLVEKYKNEKDALSSDEWKEMDKLQKAVSKAWSASVVDRDKITPSNSNADMMSAIANWFDDCVRDNNCFSALKAAMTAKVFVLTRSVDTSAKNAWLAFTKAEGLNAKDPVTLWTAAAFLVSARLQMHDAGGGNIIVAAMTVLCGAQLHKSRCKIDGPFLFTSEVGEMVEMVEMRRYTQFTPTSTEKQPLKPTKSNRCASNQATKAAIENSWVSRSQHAKSPAHETRMTAALFNMSITESIRKDLEPALNNMAGVKSGATAGISERHKNLRRIHAVSWQLIPSVSVSTYKGNGAPHLVEVPLEKKTKQRSVSIGHTTKNNVSSAWRTINGGALFSNLFYPIASPCFKEACMELGRLDTTTDVKVFTSTTDNCVNIFIKHVLNRSASLFHPKNWTYADNMPGSVAQERHTAARMLGQIHSLVFHTCAVSQNSGCLWENFKQSFTVTVSTSIKNAVNGIVGDGEEPQQQEEGGEAAEAEADEEDDDFDSEEEGEDDDEFEPDVVQAWHGPEGPKRRRIE